jgi:hypothetical protein
MGYEARPAFVPSEICRFFHSTAERLLQQVCLQNHAITVSQFWL